MKGNDKKQTRENKVKPGGKYAAKQEYLLMKHERTNL